VAIARSALKLKCELCVNMLVNHSLGSLVTGIGDLDNRVKTLLDALRVPKDPQEFKNVTLAPGLYPCLLEDDAMITALHITTDRYLACPSPSVRCELDTGRYPSGIVVSDAEMAAINIKPAEFHGEWNYTISPNTHPPNCAFIS
jgi:Rhodopirellula transposase DDE domain